MNKTRFPTIIIVASLVLAAVIAVWTYQRSAGAKLNTATNPGMGDLRRFESQQSSVSYVGMGDLHRYESQQSSAASVSIIDNSAVAGMGDFRRYEGQNSSVSSVGMGDLQRFEYQQSIASGATILDNSAVAGMGDFRLFEAQQSAGLTFANDPALVCLALSTSSGEHDAGASAPASVLQAMGCPAPASK